MPTPISHATVGFAIGAWTAPRPPATRVCLATAALAALPDVDVLWWSPDRPETSLLAHRAITHSIVFALAAALVMTLLFHHGRLIVPFALAALSHSCLDAFSRYSLGIQFLAPFSTQRFRFPWTPLGDPTGSLARQLMQEALVVFLPALVIAVAGLRVRRRS